MSIALRPQPRPGVLDIDPYVPGKSTAPGVARVFKLSSNETPLGPSPKAIAAYKAAADHLHDYPDGSATALRTAIGRAFGLDPNRLVCGAGSDDLINLLADGYLQDGDEAIYTTQVTIISEQYDIESINLGDVVTFSNFGNFLDGLLLQVVNKQYGAYKVVLDLGELLDRQSDIIDETQSTLQDEQYTDIPSTPS